MWSSLIPGWIPMRQVSAALVLGCVILVAGCIHQVQGGGVNGGEDVPAQVSCDDVAGETHTVMYTEQGFSPSALSVERCDTVVWESEDGGMWVASDTHPTHTQYDGTSRIQHCPNDGEVFDQCGSGSSYSFTFRKTGEFGYHNHELASHGGTVVVEERQD